jgi:diguanylate cyclase (GGDEF)-like protein/PAS domain S-box-containing protein
MAISLMPDGERVLISTKDITEAKQIQRQIDDYIKIIDENIITSSTDTDGNITFVSKAFCEVSEFTKEELLGENHRIIRHPDMPVELFEDMWQKITNDEVWEGEVKNKTKSCGFYWVHNKIYPIYDDIKQKVGYTAIRQDITDKKRIEELSITDGLTNIYNRRYFNEIFPKLITGAKRDELLVCFILMDIDCFKLYNDTYGHQMGDDVLIQVARAIKESLHRADDYCFRLGGEEFGVCFKAKSKEDAVTFANLIRINIENLHIVHAKNPASPFVTSSAGLVFVDMSDNVESDYLYKQADDLLYMAKENGRNRVVWN